MSKKLNSKKIKQVASKARRTPRGVDFRESARPLKIQIDARGRTTDVLVGLDDADKAISKLESEIRLGAELDELDLGVDSAIKTPMDIEFSSETTETIKKNAIERARKVDLKEEIKTIVQTFRASIDERLKNLSEQVENQMKPLVQAVASVAVAKKELDNSLSEFHASLSSVLNLNDELEPIEIEGMFSTGSALDDQITPGLETEEDEDMGILAEAIENGKPRQLTRSLDDHRKEETVN